MKITHLAGAAAAALETFSTPAGEYRALWVGDQLVFGILGPSAERSVARFAKRHGLRVGGKPADTLRRRMAGYFAGKHGAFSGIKAAFLGGTAFQRDVWRALAEVKYGQVVSYAELAKSVGRPGSARPVGQAVGANPLTIVLPCHRIVGASGALTGFGCGLPVKRVLLKNEGWSVPASGVLSLDASR